MRIINKIFKNPQKSIMNLLWIFILLASIKSIFTDFGYDNAYQVAMSCRHLSGDAMFQVMWEPHQTSIFLNDILLFVYHGFVPSYVGASLFLQLAGTLMFTFTGYVVYRTFKDITGELTASLMWMFLVIYKAKQTPFPEFANLEILFSIYVFVFIVKYIFNQKKTICLIASAVSLCLMTLSYPSCAVAILAVWVILFLKTQKRIKNILVFTLTCALCACAYVGYFACRIGLTDFIDNMKYVFLSDSHSEDTFTLYGYFFGFVYALVWFLVSALIAFVLRKKVNFLVSLGCILFVSEIILLFTQKYTGLDWTCSFYAIPLLLFILGCFAYRKMSDGERTIWLCGNLISFASVFATLVLTDLGLITILAYFVLGGMVSMLPFRYFEKEGRVFLMLMVGLITIHRGLVVWGYSNYEGVWMVTDIQNIMRSGPSKGIVCGHYEAEQSRINAMEFAEYLQETDKVFFVKNFLIDSSVFVYANCEISNFSTIDTPIYNEQMLKYFEVNPEKKPTVVALSAYMGEYPSIGNATWILDWLDEEYEKSDVGTYWTFYRLKNAE